MKGSLDSVSLLRDAALLDYLGFLGTAESRSALYLFRSPSKQGVRLTGNFHQSLTHGEQPGEAEIALA